MDLIEIDRLNAQSLQAGFAFAANRIGLETFADLAPLVPNSFAFGEHVRPLGDSLEGSGDNLLGVPQSIGGRGIDPIDAGVEGFVNRGDRIAVVLASPSKRPTRPANSPSAESDRSKLQIGVAERFGVHGGRLVMV